MLSREKRQEGQSVVKATRQDTQTQRQNTETDTSTQLSTVSCFQKLKSLPDLAVKKAGTTRQTDKERKMLTLANVIV